MNNIVSIILIIASAGMFFGFIDPTYSKVRELLTEKSQYDTALSNSKALQAERDKLLVKFNNMSNSDRAQLEKLLPNNIDNIRLIIDVDEMAKKYGMRIRNFKTDTSVQKESIGKDSSIYGTLTLSFSTTASYATFLAFVKDLERSLRIIDITAVTFAGSETSQLYDFGLTVKTYWLK